MRYLTCFALVLLVWVMLAFQYVSDSDHVNRTLVLAVGIIVAALAVLVSRRPSLPKSRGSDIGGADGTFTNYDSHNSNHHSGNDGAGGHGDSDGGDGGH